MTPLISAYLLRHDDDGLGRPVKAGKCFVVNLGDCLEPSSNGDHEELCPCLCLWRVCFIIGGLLAETLPGETCLTFITVSLDLQKI